MDAGAIAAVSARLDDAYDGARRPAVEAFAQIAEKGNADAIAALSARSEDATFNVRLGALDVLAQIALIQAASEDHVQTPAVFFAPGSRNVSSNVSPFFHRPANFGFMAPHTKPNFSHLFFSFPPRTVLHYI